MIRRARDQQKCTELGAKSPDVPSNKGSIYWDQLKLPFGSFVDVEFTMKQLIFSTFFSFVPKSEKADIDAQFLRGQELSTSGFMAPSSVSLQLHHLSNAPNYHKSPKLGALGSITFIGSSISTHPMNGRQSV